MRVTTQGSVRALATSAKVGVAAVAGLAALLLAGCSEAGGQGASGPPAPAPSSSAVPSATASPEASPAPSGTGTAPPRGRATDPATASRVTLVKSGGFAGVQEQVVVESDGRWTYTTRDGKRQAGRLTGSQAAELRKLSGSTALADEGRGKPRGPQCADAFIYTLTVGDTVIRHEQCGGAPPRPTFNAIVKLLSENTPLN